MSQPKARLPGSSTQDAFVSYASEDKDVAQSTADALRALGFSIWFDEYELRVGDSLSRTIDAGLRNSRCGIVILSHKLLRQEVAAR